MRNDSRLSHRECNASGIQTMMRQSLTRRRLVCGWRDDMRGTGQRSGDSDEMLEARSGSLRSSRGTWRLRSWKSGLDRAGEQRPGAEERDEPASR